MKLNALKIMKSNWNVEMMHWGNQIFAGTPRRTNSRKRQRRKIKNIWRKELRRQYTEEMTEYEK